MHDLIHHHLILPAHSGPIEGRLLQPALREAVVRVYPERRRQTILGFGGITLAPAYRLLSEEGRRRWWRLLKEYNLLLHREDPMGTHLNEAMDNWDRLADAVPHYYGDNHANAEVSDFDYLKQVRAIGGKVMFEFWHLPKWARQVRKGVENYNVHIDKYTAAVVRYCRLCRDRSGAPPEIVGIINEVALRPAMYQEMTLALRRALDEAGFRTVKIHTPDRPTVREAIDTFKALRSSGEVWRTFDYAATHMYDYQNCFTDPDKFDAVLEQFHRQAAGKPVLSTELCVNSFRFQSDSYRVAMAMGQLYHKNLTIVDATAIAYCWLLLNVEQPSYGMTRSLLGAGLLRRRRAAGLVGAASGAGRLLAPCAGGHGPPGGRFQSARRAGHRLFRPPGASDACGPEPFAGARAPGDQVAAGRLFHGGDVQPLFAQPGGSRGRAHDSARRHSDAYECQDGLFFASTGAPLAFWFVYQVCHARWS